MTKLVADAVYDVALNYVKNNATTLVFLDAAPADVTAATTNALCTFSGLTSTDFTVADGASGRKVTVAAQTGGTGAAAGTE